MQVLGGPSYSSWTGVTPSDSTPVTCRALLVNVTVAGNLVLNTAAAGTGTTVTIALPVGLWVLPLNLEQDRVMSTGLTATCTITALA